MIRKNRGFESHPLRHIDTNQKQNSNLINEFKFAHLENYSRGRRGAPAKGVGWVTAARVQIPHSPPGKGQSKDCPFRIYKYINTVQILYIGTNKVRIVHELILFCFSDSILILTSVKIKLSCLQLSYLFDKPNIK